jgi:hypothetical protein
LGDLFGVEAPYGFLDYFSTVRVEQSEASMEGRVGCMHPSSESKKTPSLLNDENQRPGARKANYLEVSGKEPL